MSYSAVLQHPTADFASVIPDIDAKAEHDRLQAGIGPPEEENPIEMFRAVGLTISNKT